MFTLDFEDLTVSSRILGGLVGLHHLLRPLKNLTCDVAAFFMDKRSITRLIFFYLIRLQEWLVVVWVNNTTTIIDLCLPAHFTAQARPRPPKLIVRSFSSTPI